MKTYDLDLSIDTLQALLWQYNDAEKLQAIIRKKQAWLDANHQDFWRDWIRDVFDLRTANDFGLTVWSIILGIRAVTELPPTDKANFGFGSFNLNFNNGNFGQIGSKATFLSTEQKRLLIRMRYFQMISRCTVPEINRFLSVLFRDYGKAYVLDMNDMSYIVYVFSFLPTSDVQFLLDNFDILPRPATVGIKYLLNIRPVFGFGSYNQNFNNGTFKG
jgi:hypothetical protein